MATLYSICFDFNPPDQQAALRFLQENGYRLLGFKGATGINQIVTGVPVWFANSFAELFGKAEIDYEPLYKVYAYNNSNIDTGTTIQMQALSLEVPPGTALQFEQDGTFSVIRQAPAGTISVFNNRPPGTGNLTIGLAAKINGFYQPFCAFIAPAHQSIDMMPNEKVCLFAAQTDLVAGSVAAQSSAPGCLFAFDANHIEYDLCLLPGTYGITNATNGFPVTNISSGSSLIQLLNTN